MHHRQTIGHILAALTVFVWGTTFISTKILLHVFTPVEILFIRFVLGLCALFLACPHRLKGTTKKQEGRLAAVGLCGTASQPDWRCTGTACFAGLGLLF